MKKEEKYIKKHLKNDAHHIVSDFVKKCNDLGISFTDKENTFLKDINKNINNNAINKHKIIKKPKNYKKNDINKENIIIFDKPIKTKLDV